MRIFTAFIVVPVTAFLLFAGSSHAQIAKVEKENWLLTVVFKEQGMRDDAVADIQRYETGIRKANDIISRSEKIISLARQKGNAEAERIAGNALTKASDAGQKNEELKRSAELRKRRAEIIIANMRDLMAKTASAKAEIKSVVTNHSGIVYIIKQNETIRLGEGQAGYLGPGDTVRTLDNSSVEMRFLGGWGTLKLGERSRFRVEEDGVINMLKGKIHLAIEKLEKYHNRFAVRTPTAILAIRGTEFLVFEQEGVGTEIVVFEGKVEVKAVVGQETSLVEAGEKIRVTKEGVISGPEKIDLTITGTD